MIHEPIEAWTLVRYILEELVSSCFEYFYGCWAMYQVNARQCTLYECFIVASYVRCDFALRIGPIPQTTWVGSMWMISVFLGGLEIRHIARLGWLRTPLPSVTLSRSSPTGVFCAAAASTSL